MVHGGAAFFLFMFFVKLDLSVMWYWFYKNIAASFFRRLFL